MPYTKPSSADTRGWKPKEASNELGIPNSRCGESKTPRKTASVSYPQGDARVAEKAVAMDNMGNSPALQRPVTERESAVNVNSLPECGIASYEGVAVEEGGIKLNEGFRPAIADKEVRGLQYGGGHYTQDPSNKVGSAKIADIQDGADHVFGISGDAIKGKNNKATIPGGFESINQKQFTGDGANPSNVESKVMGDKGIRKEAPFKQAKNRQGTPGDK